MDSLLFKDKVAIVTGSSRGIGKAIAIELAKVGASVVLNGRDQERLNKAENEIKTYTGKVLTVCGDVSNPTQAKNLVNKTIEAFGGLDILINNAGVSMRGDFSELSPKVFKTVFDTNVLGVVNPTIPALPHIKKSQGSIVFVSSLAGIRGLPGNSAYCSSKMALRAIVESIRIEENNSKIHVGLIYVGVTQIEPHKMTISADGSLMELMDRSVRHVQSLRYVAMAVLNNIKKRRFRTTLTVIGKILSVAQSFMPHLVEYILIHSRKRISNSCQ